MLYPPYEEHEPAEIYQAAQATTPGDKLRLRVLGVDEVGDPVRFVALLPIGPEPTGEERIAAAGLTIEQQDDKTIIQDVAFDSPAQKAGLDWDFQILRVLRPADVPSKYWMYIPALLRAGGVVWLQRRRAEGHESKRRTAAPATGGGARARESEA